MRTKNKVLIGIGITSIVGSISTILYTDKLNGPKTKKLVNIIGIVILVLGALITAKALDEELYPEPYVEED